MGRALADLTLAIPRHGIALLGAARRRESFGKLERTAPGDEEGTDHEHAPLRRILLSVGDASGEAHALRLLSHLRKRHPNLEVVGFGGAALAREGMEVWEPLADLNVMGFADVAARLPLFFRCVHRFARELQNNPPDAVVLVDYPGLHRHFLRLSHRAGVPSVDFIAPQLWAWAPWRARDFGLANRLLTILPFEPDWWQRHGGRAVAIGHPLGDGLANAGKDEEDPPHLDPKRTWIGLLPGSRRREIAANLPLMLDAAHRLHAKFPDWGFVLPHLRDHCWPLLDSYLKLNPQLPVVRAPGCFHGVLPQLRTAMVTSGTASLESVAHGVATVVVYRLPSRLGAWLSRNALSVPYISAINLMAGRCFVPEHVGRLLNPATLATDVETLTAGPGHASFQTGLAELLPWFALPGAAERAARQVERVAHAGQKK